MKLWDRQIRLQFIKKHKKEIRNRDFRWTKIRIRWAKNRKNANVQDGQKGKCFTGEPAVVQDLAGRDFFKSLFKFPEERLSLKRAQRFMLVINYLYFFSWIRLRKLNKFLKMSWNNENYDDYVSGHVADTGSAMPRKSIVESLMGSYDFNQAREEVTPVKSQSMRSKKKARPATLTVCFLDHWKHVPNGVRIQN